MDRVPVPPSRPLSADAYRGRCRLSRAVRNRRMPDLLLTQAMDCVTQSTRHQARKSLWTDAECVGANLPRHPLFQEMLSAVDATSADLCHATFTTSLRSLLHELKLAPSAQHATKLQEVYHWYTTHLPRAEHVPRGAITPCVGYSTVDYPDEIRPGSARWRSPSSRSSTRSAVHRRTLQSPDRTPRFNYVKHISIKKIDMGRVVWRDESPDATLSVARSTMWTDSTRAPTRCTEDRWEQASIWSSRPTTAPSPISTTRTREQPRAPTPRDDSLMSRMRLQNQWLVFRHRCTLHKQRQRENQQYMTSWKERRARVFEEGQRRTESRRRSQDRRERERHDLADKEYVPPPRPVTRVRVSGIPHEAELRKQVHLEKESLKRIRELNRRLFHAFHESCGSPFREREHSPDPIEAVCGLWKQKHADGSNHHMHTLRQRQLLEVEQLKLRLTKPNGTPLVSNHALHSALVMPCQKLKVVSKGGRSGTAGIVPRLLLNPSGESRRQRDALRGKRRGPRVVQKK